MKADEERSSKKICPVSQKERKIQRSGGFVMITALVLSAIMMSAAVFAFRAAALLAEEETSAAYRFETENAAMQASAIAEAWFAEAVKTIVQSDDFSPYAAPLANPLIEAPSSLFDVLAENYPKRKFECVTIDLHYANSFSSSADKLAIPKVPPRVKENGDVERAYIQRATVTVAEENDKRNNSYHTIQKSLRAVRNAAGGISVITVGVTENAGKQ